MAEAVLFSLAADILKTLATEMVKAGGSFISQKIQSLCGAKDELQSLEDTVRTIRAVLLDAEKQQWHNDQVKLWLRRLKDVLYDVQDLLDDVATEDLRWKVTPSDKMSKAVRIFFSKSNQLAHRVEVTNKIRELRKKLDRIADDRKFHLEVRQSDEPMPIGRGKKIEHPSPDENIIGREEDKKRIKQFLFDSSSSQSVSFVAIVGKGGLGKTALARLVYNDGEVQERFELRMWACVSDVFDVNSIIKELLKSANYPELENKTLDQLLNLLRETLSRKKYLLVLDDLWNEDRDKWLKLGEWLEGGERGSKVLVTTRSVRAAKVTDAKSVIHVLHGLSEDKSWNLFRKMAFGDGADSSDRELEEIGRDIVKKCGGVPLAIRTIGGLLYGKKKDEWLRYKVLELPDIQEIDEADDGILQVLKFSYDCLRSCLKHCFAYCSLFPKDFVYDKKMITHLWVAQGFIESDRGNDNLEEVADIYMTELLCRSFLDVERIDINGEVLTFKMHDLMHDLAQKVAGGECKIINFEEGDYDGGIRHASFFSKILSEEKVMSQLETSKLRTYLYSKSVDSMSFSSVRERSVLDCHNVVFELRHCRALVLVSIDIPLPPSSFGKLKHLRFLLISKNQSIQSLPDSITDLVNLQHLELRDCANLETFSRDLRKLINLRYFLIIGCRSVSHLPPLSELPSLRTLILSRLSALEFVQQTSDVGQSNTTRPLFPSLERLILTYCYELRRWWRSRQLMEEYQKHHQPSFPKLRHVEIEDCPRLNFVPPFPQVERLTIRYAGRLKIMPDPDCPSEAAVGSTFTPFSKLKHLYLVGRKVASPMLQTLLRSANNLEFMRLSGCDIRSFCHGMRHLSSLRELDVNNCEGLDLSCEEEGQHDTQWPFLTNLRVLMISSFKAQLPEGIQHVTTLQSLEIYNCRNLRSLSKWIGNLSLLEKLVLSDCENLERLPSEMRSLTSLKELKIVRCPHLKKNCHEDCPQIAHIPVIVWQDGWDTSDY